MPGYNKKKTQAKLQQKKKTQAKLQQIKNQTIKIQRIMARVELMAGIQSISGTIGNLTFRTINGKTFVRRKSMPQLPVKPTRKQKARYRRAEIVDDIVAQIQDQMDDAIEAMKNRKQIRDRIAYLYDKHVKTIKAPTKLMRAIMSEYRVKNQRDKERVSKKYRESLVNDSKTTR